MSLRAQRSNLNPANGRLLRRCAPRNDIFKFVLFAGLVLLADAPDEFVLAGRGADDSMGEAGDTVLHGGPK